MCQSRGIDADVVAKVNPTGRTLTLPTTVHTHHPSAPTNQWGGTAAAVAAGGGGGGRGKEDEEGEEEEEEKEEERAMTAEGGNPKYQVTQAVPPRRKIKKCRTKIASKRICFSHSSLNLHSSFSSSSCASCHLFATIDIFFGIESCPVLSC